ncbi:cytochrome P450 [Streptomyces cinnamoneus]|uniref:cytochrome P450 n=1 Tax=Streptomyces cinnamoneus TaxID=53446 RepID=UPI003417C887
MTQGVPVAFPPARDSLFDPPAALHSLYGKEALTPVRFPDGRPGWLATAHSTARTVLADARFTARADAAHPAVPRAATLPEHPPARPAPPGASPAPAYRRYRTLLAAQFTEHRMRRLTERAEEITGELLDAMEGAGSPADLMEHYALPLPALLLCELLGVPEDERERFRQDAAVWSGSGTSAEDIAGACASLTACLHRLVRLRRTRPADDLLSGLIAADPALTDDELAAMAFLLLPAGHETTAHQLGLGVLALLDRPGLLTALRTGRRRTDRAVEELLRYVSVVDHGPTRAAREDVEIGGTTVRAGEVVVVSLAAANRDPRRFPAPDLLDLTRDTTGHLAFGHGAHQCLGGPLARIALDTGLTALLDRLPGLRPAVPAAQIPLRRDAPVHGVHRLPVAW